MPTIYDVARRAGVSHTAVSEVINGNNNHRVGPEKQRRILEAIQELGYKPSIVARQLATGRSNTIGICFGSPFRHVFVHPVNSTIISAVGESVSEQGCHLLVASTSAGASIEQVMGDLPSQGVGGIIVVGAIPIRQQTLEAIDNCPVPVVCIDSYSGFSKASTVDIDNFGAAVSGTKHLISQGHHKITYIGRPSAYQCFMDRVRAFRETIQEHGIALDENSVIPLEENCDPNLLKDLLQLRDRPTAILCGEQFSGNTIGKAIEDLNLKVPEDIALLTFDGPPERGVDREHVSTIKPAPFDMGTAAAELLKKLLDGEISGPVTIRIQAKFDLKTATVG